jgi:small basic protein
MNQLPYVIAIILFLGWCIGFFGYQSGSGIHLVLVFALGISLFQRFSKKDKPN